MELHSCSGDHLPAGIPASPGFFVSCSSNWITAVKFGVGNVLGECEPGQVKLQSEEMLPRMGETGFNPVNAEFK